MKRRNRESIRGTEVARLFRTHRSLSAGALMLLMNPPVSRRRLCFILKQLKQKGLVSVRRFALYGGHAVFYELSGPVRIELGLASVHSATLIHNDLCSLAHEKLRLIFPTAIITREHEIAKSETLKRVLLCKDEVQDSLPDLVVPFLLPDSARHVFVAVEVERSAKSSKRLLKKFYKYASGTRLDAVLYLSEDESLLSMLRQKFHSKVASKALRIGHYKENFFLTGSCPTRQKFEIANVQTSNGRPISLGTWAQILCSTQNNERRDLKFINQTCPITANQPTAQSTKLR